MGFGQIRIQCQGSLGRHQAVIAGPAVDEPQVHLANCDECPNTRVAGGHLNGALAQAQYRFRSPRIGFMAGDVGLSCHEVQVVCLDIVGTAMLNRLFLFGYQLEFQRLHYGFGDFRLECEDIAQVTIVALSPHVIVAGTVDQLGGNAHATAGFPHAAFENVADFEFAREFRNINMLALVHKGAVARYDRQCRNLTQIGDDVLSDAVAEVLLLLIAAHVCKGQHADSDARRSDNRPSLRRVSGRLHGLTRALALDYGTERAQQILERSTGWVLAPLVEVCGLYRAHVDRQARVLETHRHEDAALCRVARFTAYPAGGHGGRSPDHQYGIGRLQLRVDLVIELLAGVNGRVPPY